MPMTTLPLTYKQIAKHPTVLEIYTEQQLQHGHVTQDTIDQWKVELHDYYQKGAPAQQLHCR